MVGYYGACLTGTSLGLFSNMGYFGFSYLLLATGIVGYCYTFYGSILGGFYLALYSYGYGYGLGWSNCLSNMPLSIGLSAFSDELGLT